MRIHSLTFRGVGPFRDEQTVDFDQLGESGLYLINGPTGAGKSTIIDCITFALYGRLANADADDSRLRSDFCGPTDPTEVNLTFETAAGRYRVVRRPAYERAKARGTGTTTQSAECHLFRLHADSTEEAVAETKGAADRELQAIIGLTREQFVQTVVLPQGQFATFLYSDTNQREEVLKRIFDTRLFEQVAAILKADAAAAREHTSGATATLQQRLGELATMVNLDDDTRITLDRWAADSLDAPLVAALQELVPAFAQQHERAGTVAVAAASAVAEADTRRSAARDEAAARAAVARARHDLDFATRDVAQARARLDAHSDLAATLGIALDDGRLESNWRGRASAADTAVGELRALIDDEAALEAWPQQEAERRTAIELLREEQRHDDERRQALPELISAQQAVLDARPLLDESTGVEERATALRATATIFEDLDTETARQPDLITAVETALTESAAADAAYDTASRSYREGIAATLALDLESGQPCPVCGATEHPHPADPSAAQVDADTVEARRREASDALSALETARTRLSDSRTRCEQLASALTLSREDLVARLDTLARERQELKDRSSAADAAAIELDVLRQESQSLTERAGTHATQVAALESALVTEAEQMAVKADAVVSARGAHASVRERSDAAQELGRALGAVADRLRELATAAGNCQRAEAALAEFPERDDFADTDAAQAAWQQAMDAHREADAAMRAAGQRLEHLQSGIATVQRVCSERAEHAAGSQALLHLADLYSAGRGSDIGLHIYVLQALFANVMEAANRRFEGLLNGRYRLALDPGYAGDGRRLQGLGVLVEDRLTGISRSARTLSGGETFCASLALALGLSDVVRETAGGVQIDSLFVDEGFGSLDGDQLDEVMEMLGQLTTGGRRVGLISHVDTMKSAIHEQIDITPAAHGRPATLTATWMA